jgi:hypothetical protein
VFVLKETGFACLVFCLFFLNLSCGSEKKMALNNVGNLAADSGELFYLDPNNRSISQPIGRDYPSPQNYKFVEIEVVKVTNPKMHAVTFEVHYEDAAREKMYLGTFSLFPSDMPGTFIVPTQGKLKSDGKLILSLALPDDMGKDDQLRASVKKLRLKEN